MDSQRVKNITPLRGSHRLYVEWDNGAEHVVDFTPIIQRFKVLKPLDDLEFFGKVAILENGWEIAWPGDIAYAADNLWTRAQEQNLQKTG